MTLPENENLTVSSLEDVTHEFLAKEPLADAEQQQIMQSAENFVQSLLKADMEQMEKLQQSQAQAENIGVVEQQQSSQQIELLKQPIGTLSQRAEDGGEVANALVNLKMTVESLDPAQISFSSGWFTRLLGYLPGVGTPIKRYLTKFESAQTVIAAIVQSLQAGKEQLSRDNITLKEDQKQLFTTEQKLKKIINYASEVEKRLEQHKLTLQDKDLARVKFIEEYLQFPIRQRLIDLQQQLLVQQQTMIASELIVRNNKELIRGVNRALHVTVNALQNATTIAMALAHQDKVLQKIHVINETTSKLLTDTASRLKTQGTAIHQQAASAQIDVEALKTAFKDLNLALEEISSFRRKALPGMKTVVADLNQLIKDTEVPLRQLEKGGKS